MQSTSESIQIALTGGAITSKEKVSLPFGSFSQLENIRWKHPGFEKRAGQKPLHTVADGTNEVLSVYQFQKAEVAETHVYAQMSDGDILEASWAPPIVVTGVFGPEVYSGGADQIPASWSKINDVLVMSNGVDQHQVYGGNSSYIDKFIVYKGSGSFPVLPEIGEDYSNEVSDTQTTRVAVLDSLGAYADFQCIFIKTPVRAKSFTFTMQALNSKVSAATVYYYNNGWIPVNVTTDGTRYGAATMAKSGTIEFTPHAAIKSKYQHGSNGWWYQIGFSNSLDANVEISKVTYDSEFQDIANIWDTIPVNAVEVYVETVTIETETTSGSELVVDGTFETDLGKIINPNFNSGITGWTDLSVTDGIFSYDTTYEDAKLAIAAGGAGMAAMGQTITGLVVGKMYSLKFYITQNYAHDDLFTVSGGSTAYGGTEHFSEIYVQGQTGTKTIGFAAVATTMYLRFTVTPTSSDSHVLLDTMLLKGGAWTDLSTGTGVIELLNYAQLNAKDSGMAAIGQVITVEDDKATQLTFVTSSACSNFIVTGGSDAYGNTQHFTETFTSTGTKTIDFTTDGTTLYLQFANSFDETVTLDTISLIQTTSTTTTTEATEVYASGAVDISSLPAGKKIKIGTSYKIEGIYIDPGSTPNIGTAATPTVKYWNGNTDVDVGTVTDGSEGMTSAGYLLFDREEDVHPSNYEGSFHYVHWYELTWSEDIAADTVIEITLVPFFDIEDFGKGQCNCVWKDRAVLSFDKWGGDIYISRTREPMMFNGADFAILSAGDGRKNKVVAMRNYYTELMVWQEDTGADGGCLTIFEGYSPTTFGKLLLSTKLGTFNNNCVTIVDGVTIATKTDEVVRTVAYFLGRHGVCMSDGRTVQIISDNIKNYFDPTKDECISRRYSHRMWLSHDSSEGVLRIGLVSGSTAVEANVFPVYDLIDKGWSFDTPAQSLTCMAEIETGNEADYPTIQIGGTAGYVYQLNDGKDDNETAIPVSIAVELDAVSEEMQLSALTTRIKDS